jgi:hypothetical protein
MSRNYPAIHYIQDKLKGFNPKFTDCVVRQFNQVDTGQEPDGCLSNSVVLYICAKEFGYNPNLCYGLCTYKGREFYHAWLEIDGTVIDNSIYGNVNFSPYFPQERMDTPYIGGYRDTEVCYGRFQFDQDWTGSMIARMEGMTFEEYMDGLPQGAMWRLACRTLDKTPTRNLVEHLRTHVKGKKIERI